MRHCTSSSSHRDQWRPSWLRSSEVFGAVVMLTDSVGMPATEIEFLTLEHREARAFELGELLQRCFARTQRAMRDQGCEDIAEIIEDRLNHHERERGLSVGGKRVSGCLVQWNCAAQHARPLAVVVGENCENVVRERTLLQRSIGRHDVDLVAVGAEHAQPGVDHQNPVDVGRLRGAAEQFADRDHIGG